ncbi:response regulator transcription factor [Pseudomonas sp. NPDC089569]|uniref:response regulator transcription factor n=1 Tax=Pseudomonas sp. NPDC089569 TaxID=3390722 RepID=UPI003CFEAE95
MRILIVEDDAVAANYLQRGLAETGHVADIADNGVLGLDMAREGIYDAMIVDRKLPGLDGLELVRRLRREGEYLPVLMCSALASTEQRVEGLQAGCDDYLTKPYAFVEVLARLNALLRTAGLTPAPGESLSVPGLELDCGTRQARRGSRVVQLQYRETLLLAKLMRHSGQLVTRDMLLESAWDYHFDPNDNVIDKHIYRLRRKLDEGFEHSLIRTITGAGYILEGEGQVAS